MTTLRLACAFCLLGLAAALPAASLAPGFDAGVVVRQDYFRNLDGGTRRGGAAPGRLDVCADLDGRAWNGSADNRFHLDVLGTVGGSISGFAGDLQTLDNVEAHNTVRVFEAWYRHTFSANAGIVQIGLQDFNAQFDALDAAATLINSSFGIDPSTAQAKPGIFPVGALGLVLRREWANGVYMMGGIYDGVPGLPVHPRGSQLHLLGGDGVFAAVETGIGYGASAATQLAVGGWYRTSSYIDAAGRRHRHKRGLYAIAQTRLWEFHGAGFDVFLQLGVDAADRNPIDHYIGAGLTATGLLPRRPRDKLSLGMARAHIGSRFRAAGTAAAETALEITWRAVINSHLAVQPDLQYILHPGAGTTDHALVAGVRGELNW